MINIFIAVFFALFFDFVVAWFYHRSKWFSDGALITGLIIGGILSPQTPWYVVIFTTASALLFKHVFKDKRKPIFNPAAAGLLVNTLFFANGQSWWNSLSMLRCFPSGRLFY
ncbi:RnfABCDGE type electron transport complex subunit D [Terrilactibacillus sp. S3-3]|nr:RnfABCDGE type electron transport complex subunit D [Terrilactibacillus sp. S3-3]